MVDAIGLAQVLVEITGTERITYAYGLARLWQAEDGNTEWYLGDALGSVRQLVDADGDVVLRRDYSPYGQVVTETGTSSTGYAYTGEQVDASLDTRPGIINTGVVQQFPKEYGERNERAS